MSQILHSYACPRLAYKSLIYQKILIFNLTWCGNGYGYYSTACKNKQIFRYISIFNMGVKGLTTYAIENGILVEDRADLIWEDCAKKGKVIRCVGIDMCNMIYTELHGQRTRNTPIIRNNRKNELTEIKKNNNSGISEVHAAAWKVVNHIILLLSAGIAVIAVFDGLTPDGKISATAEVKEKRTQAISSIGDKVGKMQSLGHGSSERKQLENDVDKLASKCLSFPVSAIHDIAEILGILNVTCLWAKTEVQKRAQYMKDRGIPHPIYKIDLEGIQGRSEADQILSTLCMLGYIDVIISSDTDFICMGCDIAIQTVRNTAKGSELRWKFIDAKRVREHMKFSLHPLIPRTSPLPIPDPFGHFTSLATSAHDVAIARKSDNISLMSIQDLSTQDLNNLIKAQHLHELKFIQFCLDVGSDYTKSIHMRKPKYSLAARATEEGLNIPDTIKFISDILAFEKSKKKCDNCWRDNCICEKYNSSNTVTCTKLGYLYYIRLPYELAWFEYAANTRTQWLPDFVPNNSWQLSPIITEYDESKQHYIRRKMHMRIGSIPPRNRIDIDLFCKKLPRIMPNPLFPDDMLQLVKELERINDSIGMCRFWNRADINKISVAKNKAIYAELQLPTVFGMEIDKVEEEFLEMRESRERDVASRSSRSQRTTSASSSDVSPYIGPSSAQSSLSDNINDLNLVNDNISFESFNTSVSSIDSPLFSFLK